MEMKMCWYGAGNMTKMAAMPIFGKTFQKSSSPEPAGRFQQNLVCSVWDSCHLKFEQMMALERPWPI